MYQQTASDESELVIGTRLQEAIGDSYLRMALQALDTGEVDAAAQAGRVLGQEMGRPISGACLERIANSAVLRSVFLLLLRVARDRQERARRRRCKPLDIFVKRVIAELA
jgi:erythromycin esterase-like protein